MEQRLVWVDYAKALCIVLVVYGHVIRGLHSADMGLDPVLFTAIDRLVYGFHMPVFFLLSGFFVTRWLKRDFGLAVKQKAALLLLPYIVWSVLQGSVNVFLSAYTNTPLTWVQLAGYAVLNPFGQFWFVYVLFFIYVLSYVTKCINQGVLVAASLVLYLISPLVDFWILDQIFRFFLFFNLGVLASGMKLEKIESLLKSKAYTLTGAGLFVGYNALYISVLGENVVTFLAAALVGMNAVLLAAYALAKMNVGVLNKIGKMTMVIYLSHILFTAGSRIVLANVFGVTSIPVQVVIGTAAGVIGPFILYSASQYFNVNKLLFGEYRVKQNTSTKVVLRERNG